MSKLTDLQTMIAYVFLSAVIALIGSFSTIYVEKHFEPRYQAEYRSEYAELAAAGNLTSSEFEELTQAANTYEQERLSDTEGESRVLYAFQIIIGISTMGMIASFLLGHAIAKYRVEIVLLSLGLLGTLSIWSTVSILPLLFVGSALCGFILFKYRVRGVEP